MPSHTLTTTILLGRCELCKTKFRFDPQYAENAPDHLPAHEVILGLTSRALAKWLPLALRISIAISVWLLVAPLLTACLYHGWMHRPSSIPTRWSRDLIFSDIVSGAIIAAIIIISFLSLMSFADFLRVHWQQRPNNNNGNRQGNDEVRDGMADDSNMEDSDNNDNRGDIDNTILDIVKSRCELAERRKAAEQKAKEQDPGPLVQESSKENAQQRETIFQAQATQGRELAMLREARRRQQQNYNINEGENDEQAGQGDLDGPQQEPLELRFLHDQANEIRRVADEMDPIAQENNGNRNVEPEPQERRPFDPMDPVLQDDQVVRKIVKISIITL